MAETYDENYTLLNQKVNESLEALDPKIDKTIVTAVRLYTLKNQAEKLVLENNKVEYGQDNKERTFDNEEQKLVLDKLKIEYEQEHKRKTFEQEKEKIELERNKLEYQKELDIQRLELDRMKLEIEKAKADTDRIRMDYENAKMAIENQRLTFEENRFKIEQESKKIDRVIRIVEIGIGAIGRIIDRYVGVSEFNAMMNFETDGGFFKGWAGKLFTREHRKEKGDY